MKLEVTERDKKLLVFLAVFLIVVGLGFGVILPLLNANQKIDAEIADAQIEQLEREQKVNSLPVMEKKLEKAQAALDETRAQYSPKAASREIDKLVTDIAVQNGVTVTALNIEMPEQGTYTALTDYQQVLEGKAEAEEAKAGDAEGTVYKGIYTVGVDLTMKGSRGQLQTVLDRYTAAAPKIRVKEFLWQPEDKKISDVYTLSAALEVYMLEDETKLFEAEKD